jgi:hypothetical protein
MRRFLTVPTAILTAVLLVAACTSGDDAAEEPTTATPAATVAPPETATTVAATVTTSQSAVVSPDTAIATVQALQNAYNAYDPDAALPLFEEDANDEGAYPGDPVWHRFNFDMPKVVGTQATLSECVADDHGTVTCIKTWTDTLLSGKAGIVYWRVEEFHVTAEGLITLRIGSQRPKGVEDNEAFEGALGEWMVIAHPEAYERFYVPAFNSKNAENWNSPDGVAELSPLIDEFVAQSDEYPLSPAVSPATSSAARGEVPSLTFDGESCTYEGPTDLKAGPVAIDFVNVMEEPEVEAWRLAFKVNLMRHKGDETIQDMVDYVGPEPSTTHQPSWVSNPQPAPWDYPAVFPGQTVNWEGNLEPGTYTMVCALFDPFGVWFGTGLTVEA